MGDKYAKLYFKTETFPPFSQYPPRRITWRIIMKQKVISTDESPFGRFIRTTSKFNSWNVNRWTRVVSLFSNPNWFIEPIRWLSPSTDQLSWCSAHTWGKEHSEEYNNVKRTFTFIFSWWKIRHCSRFETLDKTYTFFYTTEPWPLKKQFKNFYPDKNIRCYNWYIASFHWIKTIGHLLNSNRSRFSEHFRW